LASRNVRLASGATIGKELDDTDHAIYKTIGAKPAFFRPPYGVTNPMVASAVERGGYKTIGWSIRSFDTVIKDSKVLMERITGSLKGGDVILLHDYSNHHARNPARSVGSHQKGWTENCSCRPAVE
jgi:peptidoglycan/xylan/chitin deacetylase (PgdA/CDA1 family)